MTFIVTSPNIDLLIKKHTQIQYLLAVLCDCYIDLLGMRRIAPRYLPHSSIQAHSVIVVRPCTKLGIALSMALHF